MSRKLFLPPVIKVMFLRGLSGRSKGRNHSALPDPVNLDVPLRLFGLVGTYLG